MKNKKQRGRRIDESRREPFQFTDPTGRISNDAWLQMWIPGASAFGVFGSPNPTQSSSFGSTFGQTQPAFGNRPFGATNQPAFSVTSTPAFGATSAIAFGSSNTPPFGASSTPAVGASSTPSFGFGNTTAFGQSSPAFGTTSTPSFGSRMTFGSTPSPFGQSLAFGGSNPSSPQPAGGSIYYQPSESNPFGQRKPAFDEMTVFGTSVFGVFGSPNIAQLSTSGSIFGQMQSTFGIQPFGATSQPVSTSASTSTFKSTSTPLFGSTSSTLDAGNVPACGASSTPVFVFGASSTPAAGAPKTPLFGFGSTIAFGQVSLSFGAASTPAFASSTTFRSTPSPFDQSSAFGVQSTDASFGRQGFGQTSFAGQGGGSRVTPYTSTNETQIVDDQAPGKLISISSMPQYKDKSHEELRWEDYQLGDKGASAFGQKTAFGVFGSQSLGQTSPSGSTFGQKQPAYRNHSLGAISQPASIATRTPVFGSTTTLEFGTTTSALGETSVPAFGASSTPAFWTSSIPIIGDTRTPPSGFGSTVTLGQPVTAFGAASAPAFVIGTPLESTSSPFGQSSSFGAQFSTPRFGSPGFGQTPFVEQCGGSRVTSYASTSEAAIASCGEGPGKIISISAMPQYNVKSHEELRWADYSVGDKGGSIPARQPPAGGSIFSPKSPDWESAKTWQGKSANGVNWIGNKLGKTQENLGTFTFTQQSSLGELGSTSLAQSSSIGSFFCQVQPDFGRQPSGATIQPALGATSAPAFGSTVIATFGSTTPAINATSVLAIDAFSIPSSSTPAFVALSTPFGFGSNTSSVQSRPVFGEASTPSFGICTTFGSNLPFGQSSAFGAQSMTPTFGRPGFGQTSSGGHHGGSRVALYTSTNETENNTWETHFHIFNATLQGKKS